MNEFTVRLDLAKGKARQQQTVFVRQGDKNATTIVATIYDHGAAAATSGLTARFSMRLPDGTHYYRKAASLSGNVATVALDEAQAASIAGRTDTAYFQLLQGSTVVASTESFTVVVLPDALADAEVAESYDSAIQDAIDALDAAVEQMPDMVEDVLEAHPEWTTTVQDGSITKNKLATDLARDRERLMYRLANMLTATLPEGETATATDAAKTPMAGLALYGRSTQDGTPTPSSPVPIVSVVPDSQGNVGLWARGKNLLPFTAGTSTSNGVTFTVGEDGTITASGTSTGLALLLSTLKGRVLPAGTYTLSGCPSGGSDSTYRIDLHQVGSSVAVAVDYGSGATFTIGEGMNVDYCRIRIPNGTNVSGKVFRPMLRLASTGAEFVPYSSTTTPIDLGGHELRSLPDGTRDEVTVDERGHAVLTQRVGSVDLGEVDWTVQAGASGVYRMVSGALAGNVKPPANNSQTLNGRCTAYAMQSANGTYLGNVGISVQTDNSNLGVFDTAYNSASASATGFKTARKGQTLLYPLATPVTHDLGTIAAVPLVGPDLTAQAIPTAPFALTYERDLNATLARLESAIATLA